VSLIGANSSYFLLPLLLSPLLPSLLLLLRLLLLLSALPLKHVMTAFLQ
jgi:hypothetical protein